MGIGEKDQTSAQEVGAVMARIGINPARGLQSSYHPAKVSVTMITFIPHLSGYFENRLQVLELCINSLLKHTAKPYDLIIFDNGSCSEVVDFLQALKNKDLVDFLILAKENIGKIGALRLLIEAAPGEIIAYSDDDIFFYPHWLEAHLETLNSFPNVGMVSGVPVRNASLHARKSLEYFGQHPAPGFRIKFERFIPKEWEMDWAKSTGRDAEKHWENTKEHLDLIISSEDNALQAISGANHFQFAGYKQLLLQALPDAWSGNLMGSMIELDEAVDNLGYLRLSTSQRYVRHIGNTLTPALLKDARTLGVPVSSITREISTPDRKGFTSPRPKHWLLKLPGSRRVIMGLYKRLFDMLYRHM